MDLTNWHEWSDERLNQTVAYELWGSLSKIPDICADTFLALWLLSKMNLENHERHGDLTPPRFALCPINGEVYCVWDIRDNQRYGPVSKKLGRGVALAFLFFRHGEWVKV